MKTLLALTLALPLAAGAAPLKFAIQEGGMSRVSFTSDAPLETIVGTTSAVSGGWDIDLTSPGKVATASVVVNIATIKTGVDMRDEHLRGEQWLNTGKFPTATFALERFDAKGALAPGKTLAGTVSGTITIRGVTKKLTVPVTVGFFKWTEELKNFGVMGDLLRVKASFRVKLSDFGITIPSMLGSKVADTVEIGLNLTAVQAK